METSGVDVVLLDYDDYVQLMQKNSLAPLDPYIIEADWALDELAPTVLQAMRHPGDQQIYGLTPTFHAPLALLFNRQIFERTGMTLPDDRMSWDELFQLATEVSLATDGDVYGFSFSINEAPTDFYSAYHIYMHAAGLEVYDESFEPQVDREEWRERWHTLMQLIHAGVMPGLELESDGTEASELPAFLKGKIAMALVSYPGLLEMQQIEASRLENDRVEWEVVTAPVHGHSPNMGVEMYGLTGSGYGKIAVMNAHSGKQDTAWKLIHYLMSEEWASIHQHRGKLYSIRSLNDLQANEGFALEKFIQLELPVSQTTILTESSMRFDTELITLGQRRWNDALAGRLSVDDALAAWQEESELVLQPFK